MGLELIPLSVIFENGLDFVVHLAFVLIFFLFLWYIFGVNYKSKKDRIKHWVSKGAQVSDTMHNLLISNKSRLCPK